MMGVLKKKVVALVSLSCHVMGAMIICKVPIRKQSYTLSKSINLVSSKAKNQSQGLTPEFMVELLVYTVFHLSQSITL